MQVRRLAATLGFGLLVCSIGSAQPPEPRRLTIELELAPQPRSWWQKALPSEEVDGVLLSWGLALLDVNGAVEALPPQPACPQDPFCLAWQASGTKCIDFFAPGLPEWDERYSCYADSRTIFFDRPQTLFELDAPERVAAARLSLYFRDSDLRRRSWPSKEFEDRTVALLRLDPENGFSLRLRLRLDSGPDGRPADMQIASCRPSGGDPDKIARRVRSAAFRYCELVPSEADR